MIPDRGKTRSAPFLAEPWIVVALRTLVMMVAAAAVLLELSLPAGTIAAVLGTAGASVASVYLARSRVRLAVVWAVSGLTVLTALLLGVLLVDETPVAEALGPHGAMAAADVVRFGLLAVGVAIALRTTTTRRPSFAIIELLVVVLAIAGVMAAHRDGAHNHPRLLSDWAWSHEIDPVRILLYIGVGTLLALLLATLHERKGRGLRVVWHVLLLLLLAGVGFFLVRTANLPRPPDRGEGKGKDGKGNKDKDNKGKGGKGDKGGKGGKGDQEGGAGGGSSQDRTDPLPFRNDNMSQSAAPIAVVLLHDDYSPPLGYYYFRQRAFSQWNGTRLVGSTRDDIDRDIPDGFPAEPTPVVDAPKVGPGISDRQLIRTTVAMLTDHARPIGLESPIEYAPKESPDPSRFVRAYEVKSAALALRYEDLLGRKPGVKTWTDEQRAAYTQLPDDPRYKELADKIINSSLKPAFRDDPFAQAIAVSAWLGKNSAYSLRIRIEDEKDPVANFLFDDPEHVGYCVHFAHAAAYLLRARGLPTRIAEGYAVDEARRGNGSAILVRDKDAHAWAELYLDGFGWIIVDVSPQRVLDPPDTSADPDLQRMLGELARGDRTAGKRPDKKGLPINWKGIATGMAETLAVVLVLLHLVRLWRRFVPYFAGSASIHRVAYRAALDGLSEAGLLREEGETRERFAARIASRVPGMGPLTDAHIARAWGSRRVAGVEEVRDAWRRAAAEADRCAPGWLRVVMWLVPIGWLRTR